MIIIAQTAAHGKLYFKASMQGRAMEFDSEHGDSTRLIQSLRQDLERCERARIEYVQRMESMEGVFVHVADAIFVVEPDGQIIEVNPAASALLAYSREELLSMHPWDFVTSASREEILKLIQNIRQGTPVLVQSTYRGKNGEQKFMELRLTRCDLAGGDLIIASCRDATVQKRLEERLRRSERNLAEGQRLTKTGSWILDFKTGNTDWSVETCRIFGFPDPPPSPHYSEFRARVRPQDREGVDRGLRESFETGESRPLEYVFVLPDGTQKNIDTISQPLKDDAGAVVRDETGAVARLIGTVMDVTERKAAAEALRASELLARGQLEALTSTLDRLSQESEPDKFLEQVLRTIAEQLSAHSIGVWEMNESAGGTSFVANYEDARLQIASEEPESSPKGSLWEREHSVWSQFFVDGKFCVVGRLDKDPPQVRIENGQHSPWHDWQPDAASDRRLATMVKRLSASGIITTLCVPLFVAGKVTGLISIRFKQSRTFRREEIELTRALSHQAMLAIQLMRLSQQSRQTAVIAERNRMARDIHDTLAQGFTGVIIQLEAAKGATAQRNLAEVADRISLAGELARSSLEEARRSVRALRPRSLHDGTLSLALDDLLKRMTVGTGLNADFKVEGDGRGVPSEYEEGLLRITQESLTNTVKHANARVFSATLSFRGGNIQLQLVDDGRGFDPQAESDGFGLIGMKERVDQMDGEFFIRSKPGVGTEIIVVLTNEPTLKTGERK